MPDPAQNTWTVYVCLGDGHDSGPIVEDYCQSHGRGEIKAVDVVPKADLDVAVDALRHFARGAGVRGREARAALVSLGIALDQERHDG